MRANVRVWASTIALAVVLTTAMQACGSSVQSSSKPHPPEDFVARASDFRNLHTMTKVRGFYIDNRLGHLDEAIAVANSPDGGTYPVGTIIQLVPQEAMVKRNQGFSPKTNAWEFFELDVSAEGTVIRVRGVDDVVNRFGFNCAACHADADPKFDFVCETDHGCAPLPVGHEFFEMIQESDPRPL